MKLIIDIPDHLYNVIKNKECTNKNVLTKAVENGTPLDDVRAEIHKAYVDVTTYSFDEQVSFYASKVNKILDNIGKAESEESE